MLVSSMSSNTSNFLCGMVSVLNVFVFGSRPSSVLNNCGSPIVAENSMAEWNSFSV